MLQEIEDLSKLEVKLNSSFVDCFDKGKNKYKSSNYMKSTLYNGFQLLSIIKKLELLKSRIDNKLTDKEIAKQEEAIEVVEEEISEVEEKEENSDEVISL